MSRTAHDGGRVSATRGWRIACLLLLGAFVGMSVACFAAGLLPGDLSVRDGLTEVKTDVAYQAARLANEGGTWHVLLPAMALLFLGSRAARRHWWLWSLLMIVSSLIEHAFKFLVGRPRPSGLALGFPSGHSTAAATFAIILVYITTREDWSPLARRALPALGIAMMLLVGWARIVLHAHWPTDVLGGFLLGAGCAAAGAWWESARLDAGHPRPL